MKRMPGRILHTVILLVLFRPGSGAQVAGDDTLLLRLLSEASPVFDSVLAHKNDWGVQVIYTQIDRDKKGKAKFTDHRFNTDRNRYYYPASTVKLPVAILALQKLNELRTRSLDRNTTMITYAGPAYQTEIFNDPAAADGRPSIANYIKKILLVSDNEAFNRLYEFLGQEYINNNLQEMGYTDAQILHRLNISLTESENRLTNRVDFFDQEGHLVYAKPAEMSRLIYEPRDTRMGLGYMRGGEIIHEPFDFSKKNRLGLESLHAILKSIIFPEEIPEKKRFGLSADDYSFLLKYMSMMPTESDYPFYDSLEYPPNYVKFLYYGGAAGRPEPGIRIFNKPGDAYGFLIDAAYFVDFNRKIEFLLSAVIYCNRDGILNDAAYDYETIGLPFMKNLGHLIYDYESGRQRKFQPDLQEFRFDYSR